MGVNIDEVMKELTTNLNETQLKDEFLKQIPKRQEGKTNFTMYKEILDFYTQLKNKGDLTYDIIDQVFNLENRCSIDLENLREFIVTLTVMGGQDVIKAQSSGDAVKEKQEMAEHAKRCELMVKLTDAIGSAMYTNHGL